MTTEQLETRLRILEGMMSRANPKDLPVLNETYQRIMERLVALDLAGKSQEATPCRR